MKSKGLLFIFILSSFWANAQSKEIHEKSTETEIVLKQKIKVFPNPAVNVVNILGLKNSKQATIIITDISGNNVLRHQWEIRNNSITIPIPNLDAGIYVVRITSKEQQIQTKFYKN